MRWRATGIVRLDMSARRETMCLKSWQYKKFFIWTSWLSLNKKMLSKKKTSTDEREAGSEAAALEKGWQQQILKPNKFFRALMQLLCNTLCQLLIFLLNANIYIALCCLPSGLVRSNINRLTIHHQQCWRRQIIKIFRQPPNEDVSVLRSRTWRQDSGERMRAKWRNTRRGATDARMRVARGHMHNCLE